MSSLLSSLSYRGLTIELHVDSDPQSPRDHENLGQLVHWHSRYDLGQRIGDLGRWLFDLAREKAPADMSDEDVKANAHKILPEHYLILPVGMYDHGAVKLYIGTKGPCAWDSGQVGFIYTDLVSARSEYPGLTELEVLAATEKQLTAEIATYSAYLRGDVVGYVVKNASGLEIDSCWGFYPDERGSHQYVLTEAKSFIDHHLDCMDQLEMDLARNL